MLKSAIFHVLIFIHFSLMSQTQYGVKYLPVSSDILDTTEVRTLLMDDQKNLWIGTRGNGIFKQSGGKLFRLESNGSELQGAITIAQDQAGDIWFGARGLWRLQGDSLFAYPESFIGNRVNFSIKRFEDLILIGGSNGAVAIKNGDVVELLNSQKGLPHPVVHDAYFDRKNNTWWFATRKSGLVRYKEGVWDVFLPDQNCRKLLIDGEHLYIGTSNGLFNIDTSNPSEIQGIYTGAMVIPEFIDQNVLWCSSEEMGVLKVSGEDVEQINIGSAPIVYCAIKDGPKILLGTDQGVVEYIE